MQDLAKLSDLASAEIEALQAEGIDLSPAEIVSINALGWAVESPESRRLLARGAPVEVAGAFLWPLTLYAQEWYGRVGCNLSGGVRQAYALGYAMSRQYDPGEPLAIEGRTAERTVTRWARGLCCTFGELNVAIAQVLAQEEDYEQPPAQTGGMSFGDLSAFLAATTGDNPDYWERRCSAGYAYAVLDTIVRQNSAEKRPTIADPRIRAERALGWAIEKIRRDRTGA